MSKDAPSKREPAIFVSHGAPTLALDAERGRDLARWGRDLGPPRAWLVVSAHWERTPVRVGTASQRDVIHDFSGFPPELERLRYDAPAAPELARRVADLLDAEPEEARGWDHGVWVPLIHLAPAADVPVLQVSLPSRLPGGELVEIGRRLAPLRAEGVRILASGGMVHNLGALDWSERSAPPSWALDFEAWARRTLEEGEVDGLADYRTGAPALDRAHPTHEHFLPLLVAAGAGIDGEIRFPVEGFEYGSLSRAGVQFG